MKRSEINHLIRDARACFQAYGWSLPPRPKWDVTDFGLGDWKSIGLVLVNLTDEPEYCEKLMFAREGMATPTHSHRVKKEDIVCRWGTLKIDLSLEQGVVPCPDPSYKLDGVKHRLDGQASLTLKAGQRITLFPGIFHEFVAVAGSCILGEVSTANDDLHDNVFLDANVGRYTHIEEDEPAEEPLLNE